MAVVDNKVPPVPSAMDVLQPQGKSNKISVPWLQWFLALREKINILNESIVNLANLTGAGILVKNGAQWVLRSIVSPLGTIDIDNADGSGGDIELDLPESGVVPGVYGDDTHVAVITVNEFGIITDVEEVEITGGGGGGGNGVIGCTFDGGGSVIVAGSQCDVLVPFGWEIVSATLLADQTGSIIIDVWTDAYGNYPPTNSDSITASTPPTITVANKSQDLVLTGWTTIGIAGVTFRFNVDSCSTITRCVLILEVVKS